MNNPKAYIVELARSFPSLTNLVGTDPESWDVEKLLKIRGLSPGESDAVAFVAAVWYGNDNARRFNLIGAMGRWDSEHQAAFLAWASNPRWP